MEELNGDKIKIHERIATLEARYKHIDDDLSYIKKQVDNHLPTAMREIDAKLDNYISRGRIQFIATLTSLLLLMAGVLVDLIVHKVF